MFWRHLKGNVISHEGLSGHTGFSIFWKFISDAEVTVNLRVHSGTVAQLKFSDIPRVEEKVLQ